MIADNCFMINIDIINLYSQPKKTFNKIMKNWTLNSEAHLAEMEGLTTNDGEETDWIFTQIFALFYTEPEVSKMGGYIMFGVFLPKPIKHRCVPDCLMLDQILKEK